MYAHNFITIIGLPLITLPGLLKTQLGQINILYNMSALHLVHPSYLLFSSCHDK